jgi:hypothetical protein
MWTEVKDQWRALVKRTSGCHEMLGISRTAERLLVSEGRLISMCL